MNKTEKAIRAIQAAADAGRTPTIAEEAAVIASGLRVTWKKDPDGGYWATMWSKRGQVLATVMFKGLRA